MEVVSAYLCALCVKWLFQRRGRRGTQRAAEKIFKLNKQVVETEWKYVVDEDYVAASYCDSFGCAVYNYRMAHLNEAPGGSDRRLPKSI